VHHVSVVLIVDDSERVVATLRRFLERRGGWKVVAAADARTGVTQAEAHRPDVVVLDQMMPGMRGTDVLPELRELLPSARIVMHTSDDDPGLRRLAADLGADAFLRKGEPLDDLVALLT
jgi:DNA-binding NarL/FixJ family response regulator